MINILDSSRSEHQKDRSMEPMVEMCAGSSCMDDLLVQAIILGYKDLCRTR